MANTDKCRCGKEATHEHGERGLSTVVLCCYSPTCCPDRVRADENKRAARKSVGTVAQAETKMGLDLFEDFYLGDDGTLDTVIGCNHCGWEGRYNPDNDGYEDEDEEDERLTLDALEMAAEDHRHDSEPRPANFPMCSGKGTYLGALGQGAYWGRNENGDWGLWANEDEDAS